MGKTKHLIRMVGIGVTVGWICCCQFSSPTEQQEKKGVGNSSGMQMQIFATNWEGRIAQAVDWNLDSLVLQLSQGDSLKERMVYLNSAAKITLPELPTGEQRHVDLVAYRRNQKLFAATTDLTVDPNRTQPVSLIMHPCFGRLRAQILLSSLAGGITHGSVSATSSQGHWVGSWTRKGALATLLVDTLPEGTDYSVSIDLADSTNQIAYSGTEKNIQVRAGLDYQVEIHLLPTHVTPEMSVIWKEPASTQMQLHVPGQLRSPRTAGELQWTKVYPIPGSQDSASAGEWLEIFNASSDTLLMQGCRISRDQQSGDTRTFTLDSLPALAPGAVLTFGHSRSPARILKPSFSLVNTATTLWLTCQEGALVQDTVRYSSTHDTGAVFVREGEVVMRNPTGLGRISQVGDWCIQGNRNASGEVQVLPGGTLEACAE